MSRTSKSSVDFYVVFEAKIGGSTNNPWVSQLRAVKLSKGKPSLTGGQVAVKFRTVIPDSAFLRLLPEVEVELPFGFWSSEPIQVVVPEPDDEA